MKDKDIKILKKSLAVLDVYYNCDKLSEVFGMYAEGLKANEIHDICDALTEHVNSSAFYPKISDIKKIIKSQREKQKIRLSRFGFDTQQKLRDDYDRYATGAIMKIYENLDSFRKNNLKRVFADKILTNKSLREHFKKSGLDDEYNRRDFCDFLYANFLTFKQKVFSLDQYVQKRFNLINNGSNKKATKIDGFAERKIVDQELSKTQGDPVAKQIGMFGR